MNFADYEVGIAVPEERPHKRPRQRKEGDDGHRPYNPQSGPSGLHSELNDDAEGSTKRGRKRPLSCGECRRYVGRTHPLSGRSQTVVTSRLKLKVSLWLKAQSASTDPLSQSATAFSPVNHVGSEGARRYAPRGH